MLVRGLMALALGVVAWSSGAEAQQFERLKYNNPGLKVDLGVGLWAWPLPMDYNGDGRMDLVVACPDVPYNGVYFFENTGDDPKFPTFKPAVKIGDGIGNAQISYVDGHPRVLTPGHEWVDFLGGEFKERRRIHPKDNIHENRLRANQWRYVDFDGDGALDLVVGAEDWTDYGWDDAYNEQGEWTNGPLRGYVYLLRNEGTTAEPKYAEPVKIEADGKPIDVFGMPSPSFADFDGDGDLDLICGEFLDGFTYFENIGTRTAPKYAAGRRLTHNGQLLKMDLQMITPVALDWTGDGHVDLIVGDEDGRVALIEHTGKVVDGMPQFLPPRYFQQEADTVKFGALATPAAVDWDGDGDEDLIVGNSAGYIAFIENLGGGDNPQWAAPKYLEADGETIRIQAGDNGSIQGPAEAKWGYTVLTVADWDHDGRPDIIANSIWGKVIWFRNLGGSPPQLAAAQPLEVEWPSAPPKPEWNWWNPQGNELVTQWRTSPAVFDLNGDGLNDLVMLDHEGYLAFFERKREGEQLKLLPGARIFTDADGKPLRLNDRRAGGSGRRKLCFADWDNDGKIDLLINSRNIDFFRNVSTDERPWAFQNRGLVAENRLAGHTTCPTVVDWNGDGKPDLLVGAEDGLFYYLPNTRTKPQELETDEATVQMFDVQWSTLDSGETAFSNRDYKWGDVPQAFRGWRIARTSGGVPAEVAVTAKRPTTVHLATATSQKGIDLEGWTPVDGAVFHYSDGGRTVMQVYQRPLEAGASVVVPQGNWTGGVLLLPPE